ncbi:MAG TPA: hypothetical protein DHV36_06530 [Desulfobacteraceae bacterium]|nr:hypothetical protein [Desulfobacteraceae bacterium]|tara:strand:+ start:608 stop:796 length:189 start_codon:yes stop_codon:yes gene_type:complete
MPKIQSTKKLDSNKQIVNQLKKNCDEPGDGMLPGWTPPTRTKLETRDTEQQGNGAVDNHFWS